MRKLLILVLIMLFVMPVYAQHDDDHSDDTTSMSTEAEALQQAIDAVSVQTVSSSTSSDAPQGINILFMLAGALAVAGVGMATIGRDRVRTDVS
jgi:uncharacterized protein YdeI (BOF family)